MVVNDCSVHFHLELLRKLTIPRLHCTRQTKIVIKDFKITFVLLTISNKTVRNNSRAVDDLISVKSYTSILKVSRLKTGHSEESGSTQFP